jgi:hypothetical protein
MNKDTSKWSFAIVNDKPQMSRGNYRMNWVEHRDLSCFEKIRYFRKIRNLTTSTPKK